MPIAVQRHSSPLGEWEMVHGAPDRRFGGHITRYIGYHERTAAPVRRREVPSGDVTLIVSLGPSIRVGSGATPVSSRTSFVAGLHEAYAVTEHDGVQDGIEINLTPPTARMLLGMPMAELAGHTVDLADVLGGDAGELVERLAAAPGWEERFALLDRAFARRLADAAPPRSEVVWAWRHLVASDGRHPVGPLAQELGWSRGRLVDRFRDAVGLPPKPFARILRFQRVVGRLRRDDGARLAEIAYDCGYADQAHLNRDFRAFAGGSPTDFLRRRLPDGAGVSDA
jgi:AraC-like DNA-binding protein